MMDVKLLVLIGIILLYAYIHAARGVMESGDAAESKCAELCKDFASFIYETIHDNNVLRGALPMSELYKLVKGRAAAFCSSKTNNARQCRYLVDNTWFVMVALETGSNVEQICGHLKSCTKTEPKTPSTDFTKALEIFQTINSVCTDVFSSRKDKYKICNRLIGDLKRPMELIGRLMKSENPILELQKCTSSGEQIGCLLKDAPPSVKIMLVILDSMLPSMSDLKKKFQKKILPPDLECKLNERKETEKEKHKRITKRCQRTCSFVSGKFAASLISEKSSQNLQSSCVLLSINESKTCDNFTKTVAKLNAMLTATFSDHFCTNFVCKMSIVPTAKPKDCTKEFKPFRFPNEIELDAKRTASGVRNQLYSSNWIPVLLITVVAIGM